MSTEFEKDDDVMYKPMSWFIGGVPLDKLHIIRFESNIISAFEDIFKMSRLQMPHLHSTSNACDTCNKFYTPAMIRLVNQKYASDFEFFQYELASVNEGSGFK
jgi:hypothetical protein